VFTLTVFETNNAIEKALPHRDLYAMYLRKSRADIELEALGEGETLARHKERLYDLAAKHGIHPDQIVIYHEIVSGESIDDRPEVQRLLNDVYLKKFKGVLVVEVERLARGNTKDQGEVADAFQVSDTKIITPVKVYDPHDEYDQEYFEFGLFMSRREYKTIRRRLVSGKLQSVLEGNYLLPQRVYGFDIVKKSKRDRYLVENKEEAEIVRMIFDWFSVYNQSTGWISNQLTHMGIPTINGNTEWNRGTIRDMLSNKHYIGMIEWGKYKTVKQFNPDTGKTKKVRVKTPPDEVVLVKGKHKGIISEEQFEKAQSMMNRTTQAPVKLCTDIVNPLSGILQCCNCGKKMTMQRFPEKDNRQPRIAHPRSVMCKQKSLPVNDVIEAFVKSLNAVIKDYEIRMKNDSNEEERIKHQNIIQAMEAELSKQEKRKNRLMDEYESDDSPYTRDEFIERKQKYTALIDSLKQQIREAKENAPAAIDYSEQIVNLHAIIDCIQDPEVDAKAKNVFLKKFIDRIEYDTLDFGQNKGGKAIMDVYLK
jgi:hypothetical protein